MFHAFSLFVLGIAITLLLTEVGKRSVGRLRPHFLAVCKPNWTKYNCTTNGVYNAILANSAFCAADADSAMVKGKLKFITTYYLKISISQLKTV